MKKKVLVLDDDKDTLKTIKDILLKNGYDVITLEEPKKCIKKIKEKKPNIVLLDVLMPNVLGTELAKMIKVEFKKLPVIYVTILSKEEIDYKKVDGYVKKPFYIKDLLRIIEKATKKCEEQN